MNITPIPEKLPPHWQEAHRVAAQIPSPFSPDKERRKIAISNYWQTLLNAIRKDRE